MIAVLYIVREQSGLDNFLRSYEKFQAGIEHTLFLVTKGNKTKPPRHYLCNDKIKYLFVNDRGYCLTAYRKACLKLEEKYDFVCCLNSWSEIQAHNWLMKMHDCYHNFKLGMVGCTSSNESFYSNNPSWLRWICFPAFPNYHVRTTAFYIFKGHLIKFIPKFIFCKRHAYMIEAGFNSLTRQLMKHCFLPSWTIDRYSIAYRHYIQSPYRTNHSLLLVSDNSTRYFDSQDYIQKAALTFRAWGRVKS